jgi:hypothetical protein
MLFPSLDFSARLEPKYFREVVVMGRRPYSSEAGVVFVRSGKAHTSRPGAKFAPVNVPLEAFSAKVFHVAVKQKVGITWKKVS